MTSSLERAFLTRWQQLAPDAPAPTPQVLFHPTREWPFDYAFIDKLVAVELSGGSFVGGKHNRAAGMRNDYEKNNAALALGWRIFYATTDMISDDPEPLISAIMTLLSQPVLSQDAEHSMWLARVRSLTHYGDAINNNGITVERQRGSRYNITLGKGVYAIGGGKTRIKQAQEQVLELILRGVSAAATPKHLQVKSLELNPQLAMF